MPVPVQFLVAGHEDDDNTADETVVGDDVDAKVEAVHDGMAGRLALGADTELVSAGRVYY